MRNLMKMLFVTMITCSVTACLEMPLRPIGMYPADLGPTQDNEPSLDGSTDTGSTDEGTTDTGTLGPRLEEVECPPNALKGDGSGSWDTECFMDLWYDFVCAFDRPASPNECLPIMCAGNPTTAVVCTQITCGSVSENANTATFMTPNPDGSNPIIIYNGVGYCEGSLYGNFQDVKDNGGWFSATGIKMPGANPARRNDLPTN